MPMKPIIDLATSALQVPKTVSIVTVIGFTDCAIPQGKGELSALLFNGKGILSRLTAADLTRMGYGMVMI